MKSYTNGAHKAKQVKLAEGEIHKLFTQLMPSRLASSSGFIICLWLPPHLLTTQVNTNNLISSAHPYALLQVKLYYMGSLACHGYLIDELWLISSSECFMSNMSKVLAHQQSPGQLGISPNAWTAEISYEHYGNHDYQSIESNRRSIKDILVYPGLDSVEFSSLTDKLEQHIGGQAAPLTPDPSIVLAKLEKPVRFR